MILRHKSEQREQHNEKMRGGEGTVSVRHLLETEEMLGNGRLFAEITIPPGASIGLHKHEGEIEVFYFLSGSGIYIDNEKKHSITVGDTITVDDNNSHSVINTGKMPIVLVALILYTDAAKKANSTTLERTHCT